MIEPSVLQALRVLEDATLDCRSRPIDTREVREALDLVEPYVSPAWYVQDFRMNLRPEDDQLWSHEIHQQLLRVYFDGIYHAIRAQIESQIGQLDGRYADSHNAAIKAELDRLSAELAKMPEHWQFRAR